MEKWRQIPGCSAYEISALGNVRHIKRKKILKEGIPYNGYPQVHVLKDGAPWKEKKKWRVVKCVHQLVALTFLGPKPEGYEVNHKDSDRGNNLSLIHI